LLGKQETQRERALDRRADEKRLSCDPERFGGGKVALLLPPRGEDRRLAARRQACGRESARGKRLQSFARKRAAIYSSKKVLFKSKNTIWSHSG